MPAEQRGPGRWRAGQVRDSGLRAGSILQQSTQSSSGANRMRCADAGHGLSAGAGWEGSGRKAGVWNRIGEIPTSGISGGLRGNVAHGSRTEAHGESRGTATGSCRCARPSPTRPRFEASEQHGHREIGLAASVVGRRWLQNSTSLSSSHWAARSHRGSCRARRGRAPAADRRPCTY